LGKIWDCDKGQRTVLNESESVYSGGKITESTLIGSVWRNERSQSIGGGAHE